MSAEKITPSSTTAESMPCPPGANWGRTLAKNTAHLGISEIVEDALAECGAGPEGPTGPIYGVSGGRSGTERGVQRHGPQIDQIAGSGELHGVEDLLGGQQERDHAEAGGHGPR